MQFLIVLQCFTATLSISYGRNLFSWDRISDNHDVRKRSDPPASRCPAAVPVPFGMPARIPSPARDDLWILVVYFTGGRESALLKLQLNTPVQLNGFSVHGTLRKCMTDSHPKPTAFSFKFKYHRHSNTIHKYSTTCSEMCLQCPTY